MSRIDNLIAELCPDGVEYKHIEEIVFNKFWLMPATPRFTDDGEVPYITSKNIGNCKIDFNNIKLITMNDYLNISSNRPILVDDILISMIGTLGEVARVNEGQLPFYGQNMYLIRLNTGVVNIDYFLHYFNSSIIKDKLKATKNMSSQGYLKANNIDSLEIPIPPVSIQQEIVRVLDKFATLEAELEAELEARKKQYMYYAYNLLSLGPETKRVKIGDYCTVEKGKTPIQKAVAGKYPLVATTEERQTSNAYQFDCQAVCVPLISARGHGVASISRIYFQEGKFALGNILCAIMPDDTKTIYAKFLRYYLFLKKDILLVPLMRGGANVSLTVDSIKKVEIPLISINEQYRIVEILDKFDTLCNSLSEGLPAEIFARHKQYEYYRGKLLTFKEKV